MFDNKNKAVSGIVALSGTFVTPGTAQASLNRSNLSFLAKSIQKSAAARQTTDILNKVKASKRVLDFVKKDAERKINKARNIRNNALRKVNQAEEIAEGAKEDWSLKVIIAVKKLQEFESKPEKKYLLKQVQQAKQDAEQAKENFDNKISEVTQKNLLFQQCEADLDAVIKMQNNRIHVAEMACKIAQIQQQKAITYAA